MNLELNHLAPYLPYELKGQVFEYKIDYTNKRYEELTGIENWQEKNSRWDLTTKSNSRITICSFKPILRPISDLNLEIEFKDKKFYPIDELAEIDEVVVLQYSFEFFETSMKYLPHWIVEQLLEWHFDVFKLIEKGLAISIHDVEQADA